MRVEPDEDRRKSDKAVHRREKLRHLGHLDALGQDPASGPAARDHRWRPAPEAGADMRGRDRQYYAEDAVTDGPFGAYLARVTAQRKSYSCNDVGGRGETVIPDTPLTTSGTWQACAR